MRLAGEQIRLLLICYGFSASLAVYYGLIWRQSLLVTFLWFHLVVCFGIPLAHALWEGGLRKGWRALWRGDDLKRPEAVFVGLASGVPLFAAALAGIWLMMYSGADLSAVRFLLDSWGLAPEWVVLFGLYLGVVNSFLEELLWRGFVLDRLVAWGRRQAILINSFFYSLYHLLVATALFGQQ
ncbi:CPBP family intramembrane metalloprotease [Brevibacillus humidisoli]|uniref:CPBP family intramembrane glutamic endopeptidase n=1 Tax=Brevibacillus humidisoli TaxID=2895522 RepID=UPI001E375557|nr:CPBP family intramembrane glutamic endopeptidase [Brevibacillus humidisoli]UFJ41972.1 CPBP family intramembrane metalloprotease [Brevibacillus humidisoli]